jgi:Glycosyl hydrolases family 18/Protein kinase domain
LKPANILVEPASGKAWLMGFGIASRLPRERQPADIPEVVAGTLAYMAPEQTGRMNRSIDSRSDLYSFGVSLYEMLTGQLPFTASDAMEWVHCHVAREPIPPDERIKSIPGQISAIVMKLIAKTAEERYQTAAGVAADLKRCLSELELSGRIVSFRLKQLASLGDNADIGTLAMVNEGSADEIHSAMWEAVRAGLVLKGAGSYKFLHDRAREAAYLLIPAELRAEVHLRIGHLLIAKMTQEEIADSIFNVVNQLNFGAALISDRGEKERAATLNLRAADHVDWLSIMSYDLTGSWNQSPVGPHTALLKIRKQDQYAAEQQGQWPNTAKGPTKDSTPMEDNPIFSVEDSLWYWSNPFFVNWQGPGQKVARNKLVAGVPLYGYDFAYKKDKDPESGRTPPGYKVLRYKELVQQFPGANAAANANIKVSGNTPRPDFVSASGSYPYAHNIYLETPDTVVVKLNFLKKLGLQGVIIWELSNEVWDDGKSIVKALY